MRRKPNLIARLEKCEHLLVSKPELLCGNWLDTYPYEKIYIELGCGRGQFAIELAKMNPNTLIVAIEKSDNVIVSALERAVSEGTQNVRFIIAMADNLTDYFAPGEASQIYINFCDPWPANRHIKRRLTHKSFLERYLTVLQEDGEVHFKTDNIDLFEYSLDEFESCGFSLHDISRDLHKNGIVGLMTEYETKFHDLGMPIAHCIATISRLRHCEEPAG